MQWLKRFLIGKPLKSALLKHEKYNVFWGLSILSCDAISSIAYAGEQILLVLVPAIGFLAYDYMLVISGAIIALLVILTTSYRQMIEQYPSGGTLRISGLPVDYIGTYTWPGFMLGIMRKYCCEIKSVYSKPTNRYLIFNRDFHNFQLNSFPIIPGYLY